MIKSGELCTGLRISPGLPRRCAAYTTDMAAVTAAARDGGCGRQGGNGGGRDGVYSRCGGGRGGRGGRGDRFGGGNGGGRGGRYSIGGRNDARRVRLGDIIIGGKPLSDISRRFADTQHD